MGFDHRMLGISKEILEEDYILQIAVLEEGIMEDLEKTYIEPCFDVDFSERIPHIDDYRDIAGLEVRPPDVWRFFVRVKELKFFESPGERRRRKKRQSIKLGFLTKDFLCTLKILIGAIGPLAPGG